MSLLSESIVKNKNKIKYRKGNIALKEELEQEFTIPELSSELNDWYANLPDFDYLSFPWPIEELKIVGKKYLLPQLGGYRFVPTKNKWEDMAIKGDWKENWVIIATCSINPLIADISQKGTPIYYAIEGFQPRLLVDSLDKLDFFLGTWLNLHENEFCDLGSYLPSFFDCLDKEWNKELSENEMAEIYEYMPILIEEDNFDSKDCEEEKRREEENGVRKGRIIIEDLGSNKQRVLLAIKNEVDIGIDEIKDILKKNKGILCEGGIGNMIRLEKFFSSLGAVVILEKIK